MLLPKVDDTVKILTGVFYGGLYKVVSLAPNAPKSIGVYVESGDTKISTVWFKPDEVEIIK